MFCRKCGAEIGAETNFCPKCGAEQHAKPASGGAPSGPPLVESVPADAPAPARGAEPPDQTPYPPHADPVLEEAMPRKRGCCALRSCGLALGALLVFALLVLVAGLLFTNLPERVGLRPTAAERLLSGPVNREAGRAIMGELAASGLVTDGMSVYVLPVKGEEFNVAYAVLDASEGFNFSSAAGEDPVLGSLVQLATGSAATECGIERVAIDYRDDLGESKLVMTAPVDALQGFAAGSVSLDEIIEEIDAQFSMSSFYEGSLP